ncbi:aspartate aminotransferase family protein [Leeuwenhoekiella blandensis]|uniref:aspartate aminotransferase family protein n=1 Tax=Leeuwenhoekiella blandensis TaxID=360293 RepID=UPI000E9D2A55|nr:aspartate aminotransferase family protein [Leeuwenhoekiella blandensis]HBT08791.1 aspartate aminotransferase family protein [Leeuwenhoekiella sp.]|tara:strand:+ start:75 stop:1265 length:1191 start_codon:yes stop_codon:yes gene_type:complete
MKADFFKYQAQTSPHPLAMEVSHAKGSYIYDTSGKAYLDFVAGVSAASIGHCHPAVVKAIQEQSEKYLHVMVYGEYAQDPAVELTRLIAANLPDPLEQTYLVNSGTEAIDGAMKLARRVTGRSKIISANQAYHGNTFGALSLMNYEERVAPFRPVVGDISHINFNSFEDLEKITEDVAGVVLETIQGGAGFIQPENGWLTAVKKRCEAVGALLILDEIQPGFGRTGAFFGFENYNVVPDVVVMGKGMGGGMPIGAFTASTAHMRLLSDNPKMGHITTFGGHPVIAAAALATSKTILEGDLIQQTLEKENLFRSLLKHQLITEVRGKGLMLAALTPSAEITNEAILMAQDEGLILFWLLFETKAIRITPPLTISEDEIVKGCEILLKVLDKIATKLS